jgi:hypothetical protein
MITVAERRKLDRLFRLLQMFNQRGWMSASEAKWSQGIAFIKRGPLVLYGNWNFLGIFVITPFHADWGDPLVTDPQLVHIEIPVLHEEGQAVRVYDEDEGPWWLLLRSEIPQLDEWIKAIIQEETARSGRLDLLQLARTSVETVSRFRDSI